MPAILTAADQLDVIREIAAELYSGPVYALDRLGFAYYRRDEYEWGATFCSPVAEKHTRAEATALQQELSLHVAEYIDDPETDPDLIMDDGNLLRL